jgi:hypothetical protein
MKTITERKKTRKKESKENKNRKDKRENLNRSSKKWKMIDEIKLV